MGMQAVSKIASCGQDMSGWGMPHHRVCHGRHAGSDLSHIAKDESWSRSRDLAEAPLVVQVEQIHDNLQPSSQQVIVGKLWQTSGQIYWHRLALDLPWQLVVHSSPMRQLRTAGLLSISPWSLCRGSV